VSPDGDVSEHLLLVERAEGVTAEALYTSVVNSFEKRNISLSKLVAQTYDGAANMSGCYRGLQVLIKENVGQHVLYVHCHAHVLNLVLADVAMTSVDTVTLFNSLETLYVLLTKSLKVSAVFEDKQKERGEEIRSIKRLNTVRWSSREACLTVFLHRYTSILETLENVSGSDHFEGKARSDAAGLLSSVTSMQFLATACLFQEIFALTGHLSRYLQGVELDVFRALQMVDGVVDRLRSMRSRPQYACELAKTIDDGAEWRISRIKKRKVMPGELSQDEPADGATKKWERETFLVIIDTISSSMTERFSKNKAVLRSMSYLSPTNFMHQSHANLNTVEIQRQIQKFCDVYTIDAKRCAGELFSFATAYKSFESVGSVGSVVVDADDDAITNSDCEENPSSSSTIETQTHSVLSALAIICDKKYYLMDAFPVLARAFAIVAAIPISSCTSERSFSALKRIKTRLRSPMSQERLCNLLLMAVEHKILYNLDRERMVDCFASSSSELMRALHV
jgi:hypothetical protein